MKIMPSATAFCYVLILVAFMSTASSEPTLQEFDVFKTIHGNQTTVVGKGICVGSPHPSPRQRPPDMNFRVWLENFSALPNCHLTADSGLALQIETVRLLSQLNTNIKTLMAQGIEAREIHGEIIRSLSSELIARINAIPAAIISDEAAYEALRERIKSDIMDVLSRDGRREIMK